MQRIPSTIYDGLGDVLSVIWHIEQWADDKADWCRDGGIIRNWAEPIFRNLHDFFSDLWDRVYNVKTGIPYVVDFLNQMWDGWGLNELISRVFYEWNNFRQDPLDWIKGKMTILIPGFGMMIQDPWQWMTNVLFIYYRATYDFFNDPWGVFLNWAQDTFPLFYAFIIDSVEGLKDIINRISHEASLLIDDPRGYIKHVYIDLLGWSNQFWVDPWGYLFSNILDYADLHVSSWAGMISSTGERIIRYIWEGRI